MASTHSSSPAATAGETPTALPQTLMHAFATVRDPPSRHGRRFTVAALLTLAVTALLVNHLSPLAIAQWGAEQDAARKRAMGFTKGVTPQQFTVARLFRRLDPSVLPAALTAYGAQKTLPAVPVRGAAGVAIDGKAYHGVLACTPSAGCPVHTLTAYTHERGTVLAQETIAGHTDKAEAELTVAPRLIGRLDWHGRVLTGRAYAFSVVEMPRKARTSFGWPL